MARTRKSRIGARKAQVPPVFSGETVGKGLILPSWITTWPHGWPDPGVVILRPDAIHHAPRLAPAELGLLVRLALVLAHRPGLELDRAISIASHENAADAAKLRRALRRCA